VLAALHFLSSVQIISSHSATGLCSSDACSTTLQDLLSKCKFQHKHDTLVLVGDLVRCSTLR
jgi:hypothetical protein